MKKFFCIVICFFISSSAYALSCHLCCPTKSDTLFCTASDGEACTGGCDCCPAVDQIGKDKNNQYFCCTGDTPQPTERPDGQGDICCPKGAKTFMKDATSVGCCTGEKFCTSYNMYKECSAWNCCPKDGEIYCDRMDDELRICMQECCPVGSFIYEKETDVNTGTAIKGCCPDGGEIYCASPQNGNGCPTHLCCQPGKKVVCAVENVDGSCYWLDCQ